MATFAAVSLDPGGLVAWAVVCAIAGLMAGLVMSGRGFGLVGDIVVGLIGALVGGYLFGTFVTGTPGYVGSILIAFLSACLLIWLLRAVAPGRVSV